MRWLVTGASGFVGRHLLRVLSGEVVAFCHGSAPHLEPLCQDVLRGDLAAPEDWPDLSGFDGVVHLAGEASPQRCAKDPARAFRVNVAGTFHLLQAVGKCRFVYVSTGQVFGPTRDVIREDRVPDPVGVYGATKAAAESLVLAAHRRGELDACVVRPFNLYGPGQSGPYVVPELLKQIRSGGDVTLQSLEPVRDFTYVGDAVDLLRRCATQSNVGGRVFHIASGQPTSIHELARTALQVADRKAPVSGRLKGRSDDRVIVDPSRTMKELDWQPTTPLLEGLRRTWTNDAAPAS